MKILLLQLSDVHIKTPEDAVLQRGEFIVAAVKNLLNPPDAIIVIVSGDVAYSGLGEEYLLAWELLDQICRALHNACNPRWGVHKTAVPGNHDCNFDIPSEVRAVMLKAIQKNPDLANDNSVVEACIDPQRAFFEFRDAFLDAPPASLASVHPWLYYEHSLVFDQQTINLRQFNTAWMSMIPDPQGGLLFPLKHLTSKKVDSQVEIAIFHHPYNWLESNNARAFRHHIEDRADLIFTGHEHVPSHTDAKREQDAEVTFIEGGVLQDSYDPSHSSFNAVLLNTDTHKRRIIKFHWDGEMYAPSGSIDPFEQEFLWQDYKLNPARLKGQFALQHPFAEYLNDLEINLTHRVKGQLKLEDIFVFPDLREIRFQKQASKLNIKGEDVLALMREKSCILITGDDFSGRTALAKMLFTRTHDSGEIPILIDGSRCTVSDDRVEGLVERMFCEQYNRSALENFRQVDRSKRLIIIDNLHKIPMSPDDRSKFLVKLRSIAFRIVAFAHALEAAFIELSSPETSANLAIPFHCYELLPFGQLRRNRLVERWLMLDGKNGASTEAFAHTLDQLTELLNSVIGKNFLPPYPVYVLAALQAAEAGTDLNVDISTHGYLYEVFIKTSLARRATPVKINIITAFLTKFAFELYQRKVQELRVADVQAFFDWFSTEYDVTRAFDKFLDDLVTQHILKQVNDKIAFRHSYLFYYFTACHLRDTIHQPSARNEISLMVNSLEIEQSANVLLFLTHLSKDPFILERLLDAAASQYSGVAEVRLESDVEFLNKLNSSVSALELPSGTHRENRDEHLTALDESDDNLPPSDDVREDNPFVNALNRLNSALKTIQILGQVLKNFPANINREGKASILLSANSLGKRVISDYLNLLRENEGSILTTFVYTISHNEPSMLPADIRDKAVATVVGLSQILVYGIIKRLSNALGSKDFGNVYERVFGQGEEIFNKLLLASLNLDHSGSFPEKLIEDTTKSVHTNTLAYNTLRYCVFMRLMLFPAKFQTRQRMAALLNFSQKSSVARSSQQALLK